MSEERRVLLFWPEGSRSVVLPESGKLTIGRAPTCDVMINHESVSRVHAAVHVSDDGRIMVEDLESSNGTKILGKKLPPSTRVPIDAGTLVEIGLVTLVVQGHESIALRADNDIPTPPGTVPVPPIEASTMERLGELITLVSKGQLAVLILGEKGVGKEVMADRIHRASPRGNAPFVKIRCAEISPAAIEKEIFGSDDHVGLLEAADGATLFLDEVSALPKATQEMLSCALEARALTRVGGATPRSINVRVVASTHRDLARMVETGEFLGDLYKQLDGISITIPPLRDRATDIPELVQKFVHDACIKLGVPDATVTSLAMAELQSRPWLGNIRELGDVVTRAVQRTKGAPIDIAHLTSG